MKSNTCQVVLVSLILAMPAVCHARDQGGTTFQTLSQTMKIVTLKNDLEIKAQRRAALKQLIEKQIAEAKEKSSQVLSKETLAKIKAQADAVIDKAKKEIEEIEAELKEGSMIFCSSQIIE